MPISLLFAFALAAPFPFQAPDQEVVVVSYDLAPAMPRSKDSELTVGLLPSPSNHLTDMHDAEWDQRDEAGYDFVLDLLRDLLTDELEYEDRSVWLGEDGRLVVRGPRVFHGRIASVLAFLEEAFTETAEIALDLVDLDAAAEPFGDGAAGEVPLERAQAWLDASDPARRRSLRLRLRPGSPQVIDLAREIPVVGDYDVEIAQGAFIHDPVVELMAVGLRLHVRAAPSPGGLALALVLRDGEAGELRERTLRQAGLLNTEFERRVRVVEGQSRFQTLEVRNRSIAINALLGDGGALVVPFDLATATGRVRSVLVIRSAGGGLQPIRRLRVSPEGTPEGRELVLLNVESWEPPVCSIPDRVPGPAVPPPALLWRGSADDSILAAELRGGRGDLVESWMWGEALEDATSFHESWPWRILVHSGEARELSGRLEELLSTAGGGGRPVEVAVALRRGGDAEPVARLALPLRSGESAGAVLGVEGTLVAEADVEVAQIAAASDPIVFHTFDGLALWLQPRIGARGDLVLGITAMGHLAEGPRRTIDLEGELSNQLEQQIFQHLFASDELVFRAGAGERRGSERDAFFLGRGEGPAGGRGQAVLGDTSGRPGALSLEVSVRW